MLAGGGFVVQPPPRASHARCAALRCALFTGSWPRWASCCFTSRRSSKTAVRAAVRAATLTAARGAWARPPSRPWCGCCGRARTRWRRTTPPRRWRTSPARAASGRRALRRRCAGGLPSAYTRMQLLHARRRRMRALHTAHTRTQHGCLSSVCLSVCLSMSACVPCHAFRRCWAAWWACCPRALPTTCALRQPPRCRALHAAARSSAACCWSAGAPACC